MQQSRNTPAVPDFQNVTDAVITSIADDLCIPPDACELQSSLKHLGYESTVELLNLAYLLEKRLKLIGLGTRGRIEFILGVNDEKLLESETIYTISRRMYLKILGYS